MLNFPEVLRRRILEQGFFSSLQLEHGCGSMEMFGLTDTELAGLTDSDS